MRVAFYPQPHQHLLLFIIFLIVLILTGVRWYLIVLFDLRFPYEQWCWATFHVSGGLLYVFGKMSIKVLCSFIFFRLLLMFSCMTYLYILDSILLSDICLQIPSIQKAAFSFFDSFLLWAKVFFVFLPGSCPGWSRVFEAGTASARVRIQ